MIEEVYRVSYRDSFGYARTLEEAKEMEKTFRYRYADVKFGTEDYKEQNHIRETDHLYSESYIG